MELVWILNNGHCANNGCFQNTVCKIGTSGANITNLFKYLKKKKKHPKENGKSQITGFWPQPGHRSNNRAKVNSGNKDV